MPARSGTRWKLPFVIGGVAVAAAVALVVLHMTVRDHPVAADAAPAQVELHTGAEPGEQPRIAAVRDVLAKLPEDLAAGRTDRLTVSLVNDTSEAAAVWRPAAVSELDSATWWRTGDIVSVVATVTAAPDRAHVWLTLSLESGGWHLADVERLNP